MSVKERDPLKASEEAAPALGRPGWVKRLNDYGEKHATAIISISTGLIILTVLIFAKHFYDEAQAERAEQELAQAATAEKLLELKAKYGATPAASRIVFRLANQYYEDNKLDAARSEYQHFRDRWPGDPLGKHVLRALASLDRNRRFEEEQKQARLKEHKLQTHPRQLADLKDPRLQWAPEPPPANPVAEIELAGGKAEVELFQADAPKAVASFLKLAESKHFDGVKWDVVKEGERLETQRKAEGAADESVPFEPTARPGEAGALVMVRKDAAGDNLAGRFQVLLKAVPDLKDATVFGVVKTNLPALQAAKKDDAIKSVRIPSKKAAAP
jgi:cyclophilin family peptidyl-prolyl cis-trans isomerase